jgi:hypothetical protein
MKHHQYEMQILCGTDVLRVMVFRQNILASSLLTRAFINPAIVLFMLMLSFIFVVAGGMHSV